LWLIHDVVKETEGVTCHDRTDSCTNDVRDADAETDTDNGAMPALDSQSRTHEKADMAVILATYPGELCNSEYMCHVFAYLFSHIS